MLWFLDEMNNTLKVGKQLLNDAYLAWSAYDSESNAYLKGFTLASLGENAFWHKTQDGKLIVAIRGTDSIADWLKSNLKFKLHDACKDYKAHHGFYQGALDILDYLVDHGILDDSISAIEIVGHSLGGGIGVQLQIMLTLAGYYVQRLTTFGAPRSMCETGAELHKTLGLHDRTVQVRNEGDYVCRVLLSLGTLKKLVALLLDDEIKFGASHPWCNAILTNPADGVISIGPEEWENSRARHPDTFERIQKIGRVLDGDIVGPHLMQNYVKALGG